ncbi:MAG: DUF1449 domain-containing protein, partial [Microcystaceae cyanobacterium]
MLLHPANFLYWTLIFIGAVFFLLVIFSGGGDDDIDLGADADFEVDADIDADIDVDVDVESDVDTDGNDEFSPWRLLSWIGLGKSPLMILLGIDFSSWGMTGWTLNTIFYTFTGRIPDRLFGFGGLILIISLLIAILIGKLLSHPIGKIFASFGEDVSSERLIGCVGKVCSGKLPYLKEGKIGQVDVYDTAGNLVSISAALPHWVEVIPHRGSQVLIIEK